MATQSERGMQSKVVWFSREEWETLVQAVEKMNSTEFRDVRATWVPGNRTTLTLARFIQVAAVTAAQSIED